MIGGMTETPQRADRPSPARRHRLPPRARPVRPPRLYQAAAWAAIVAGIVFIVSAVFFTGFFLGRHGGGFGQARHHRLDQSEFPPPPRMMPLNPGPMGPANGPSRVGAWPRMGPVPTNPGTPQAPSTAPTDPDGLTAVM